MMSERRSSPCQGSRQVGIFVDDRAAERQHIGPGYRAIDLCVEGIVSVAVLRPHNRIRGSLHVDAVAAELILRLARELLPRNAPVRRNPANCVLTVRSIEWLSSSDMLGAIDVKVSV